ncbi:hypothetical protein B9Z55_027572 [Caenorhabditis nigoni]|uniref:Uncharacterized protein n=1 Tax=Caenorhabditis nigoni TaxID=1611254 RepID=A0A2G5SFN3_9PELO|nr:hypothetical protein B9Z55_027572 [Caenorhabditis nigoni]
MWGSTWQQKIVQNRPSSIWVMGSILANFQNSFSSSSYIFVALYFSMKIDLEAIFAAFLMFKNMKATDTMTLYLVVNTKWFSGYKYLLNKVVK